jgi:hypothetical protein
MSEGLATCETCRYWNAPANQCHRKPPGVVFDAPTQGSVSYWPVALSDDWCGEWAARRPTRQDPFPSEIRTR